MKGGNALGVPTSGPPPSRGRKNREEVYFIPPHAADVALTPVPPTAGLIDGLFASPSRMPTVTLRVKRESISEIR